MVKVFLDAHLKGTSEGVAALQRSLSQVTDGEMEFLAAAPLPPRLNQFSTRIEASGAASAVDWCKKQAVTERPLFAMWDLNTIGYELIDGGHAHDAVMVFVYMTELYPDLAKAWDGLAEAQVAAGEIVAAIETYERAIARAKLDDTLGNRQRNTLAKEMAAAAADLKKHNIKC